MIVAITCVDKNWGIGYQGKLLTKIPEDMKFFHEKTKDSIVIMGRKTYDSLPENKKPLPNRENIIISKDVTKHTIGINDTFMCYDMSIIKKWFILMEYMIKNKNLCKLIYKMNDEDIESIKTNEIFIIGGGQIYKELLPYCEKIFVTEIDHEFENVDTYFPNLRELPDWYLTKIGKEKEYNGLKYRFNEYEKFNYKIINVIPDWSDFSEWVEIQLSDKTIIGFPIKYYFHGSKTVEYIGNTNMPLHFEVQENFDKFLVKLSLYKQNKNKEV